MEKISKENFDKLRGIEIGKMQEQKRIIEIIEKFKDFRLYRSKSCQLLIKRLEWEIQSQGNVIVENGGSIIQGSSNTFEPKTYRQCDSARNDKSKEAPKIKDKYGRSTKRIEIDADETGRSCKDIPAETIISESFPDSQKGCGETTWNDYIKSYQPCGTPIAFPDVYLLCSKCEKEKKQ